MKIIRSGPKAISTWLEANPGVKLDLRGANLRRIDLVHCAIPGANFSEANLEWADFRWADLMNADFSGATLSRADFHKADMVGVGLQNARLLHTNLEDANLGRGRFDNAVFGYTRLLNTDLAGATGLFTCLHRGPSTLDSETIQKFGPLPVAFLRGCGLNDNAIRSVEEEQTGDLTHLLEQHGPYQSVFISYSSKDHEFASKLHGNLQEHGVRCWFAPEDMKIGSRILDSIYNSIRVHERLLLVLSDASVGSDWVEDEVKRAFAEERERGHTVIFPVRLDDVVMVTEEAWAKKIHDDRHIGDFTNWKDPNGYATSLSRLLKDLER